MNRRTNI